MTAVLGAHVIDSTLNDSAKPTCRAFPRAIRTIRIITAGVKLTIITAAVKNNSRLTYRTTAFPHTSLPLYDNGVVSTCHF
jgi:hypothetical protein